MPIFANIRKTSKYHAGQAQEKPFPVQFEPDFEGTYHWKGNYNKYRTNDLIFYKKNDDSYHELYLVQYASNDTLAITHDILKNIGDEKWGASYWAELKNVCDNISKIVRREHKKQIALEESGEY